MADLRIGILDQSPIPEGCTAGDALRKVYRHLREQGSSVGVDAALFCLFWARDLMRRSPAGRPTLFHLFVGFVTDFFDTLGIGSFATTTSLLSSLQTV